jgi:EF hand domain-containing protein
MVLSKEVNMKKPVLALAASAVISAFSVLGPVAQAQGPATSNQDGGSMMGHHGMIGGGMMGGGMMGGGMIGREGMSGGRPGGMAPMMMRMMFSLMDADGDGKLSLQEFQAAHERIFKAVDVNKDGFVTFDEMQNFLRGTSTPAPQQ